ncbi:MAG TPA: hypothetical protein VMU87_03280 [Stellaceae bacterium]|nr:hypothetical protein [Stellaceae bacterium]
MLRRATPVIGVYRFASEGNAAAIDAEAPERRRMKNLRQEQEDEDARFTASLAGLAVTLFLALVGLYLLDALSTESRLEDCLLQGRMDCLPIHVAVLKQ